MTGWPPGMTVRPLTRPGITPDDQRRWAPFRASWTDTLQLLTFELGKLDAHRIVLEIDIQERDLRLDGTPRANATPASPAVAVAFDSTHGPLRYATDTCRNWKDNVRAIALSLEALRKVDRYGVTRRGEQYTGWRAIENTAESPLDVLARHSQLSPVGHTAREHYARAVKRVHPDVGGSRAAFDEVQAARRQLEQAGAW